MRGGAPYTMSDCSNLYKVQYVINFLHHPNRIHQRFACQPSVDCEDLNALQAKIEKELYHEVQTPRSASNILLLLRCYGEAVRYTPYPSVDLSCAVSQII
jgi:hypothetical protein